ncbi:MAG: PadR family transcriptional regulator [Candidatus Diapherotrites archaeon CG11_big_fil_rev_8_21_14_0_20_37_9]|nr:MAG: PadR family transcriptional regulator [Candidatus Diapherotrites archaeon CG11_big_fil_rev_8_21_14_0_20_37_9]
MDKDYCCDMRGMLSFLILFLLSKKGMCGQELADEIGKRKGDKPSPGTIYPALKSLREQGYIQESKDGKTINYSLTADGKKALKASKEQFMRTFGGII